MCTTTTRCILCHPPPCIGSCAWRVAATSPSRQAGVSYRFVKAHWMYLAAVTVSLNAHARCCAEGSVLQRRSTSSCCFPHTQACSSFQPQRAGLIGGTHALLVLRTASFGRRTCRVWPAAPPAALRPCQSVSDAAESSSGLTPRTGAMAALPLSPPLPPCPLILGPWSRLAAPAERSSVRPQLLPAAAHDAVAVDPTRFAARLQQLTQQVVLANAAQPVNADAACSLAGGALDLLRDVFIWEVSLEAEVEAPELCW